ncbi:MULTISPECIES: acyl-CoA dehydrogenase family protein [Novosphingobium]|uniref:acyl-CoA dehydrogenase family protein n=1 Tax=Novosphingobium TaxID=165696 RepID=UPI0022F2548A|nr:acyl-CoA dehydrogenase family protein [Novosphingobium resinovorum]GLK44889.1 acyl-CoA dehydrogenase [Novosphingobium resinovorum]
MSIEPATELLDREPLPAPRFADEADAIAAAHEAAARIAAISADPAERSRIPHEQSAILERSGVTTVALSPEEGGIGASVATIVEITRIISAADGGVGQLVQIHNMMLRGILRRPDDALRRRVIADIAAGKRLGHAAAEVGGKHKFDIRTTAARNAQGQWVVNGAKFYATGSYLAEWISSGAKTEDGQIGFLVHRDTPGLILDDDWHSFGQRHSVSGGVRFENLVLEDWQVSLPGAGAPQKPERTGLTWAQINHAAIDAGIARGAFEAAIHYLGNNSNVWIDAEVERAVQEPLIIKRIGDYAVALRVAESLLRDAAELYDAYNAKGRPSDLDDELILAVAAARVKTDEAALLISSDMFSLLGASSSYRKFNLDRFWADVRVHTTHDPIRWRLHHVGDYYLNGTPPHEYSAAAIRRPAEA